MKTLVVAGGGSWGAFTVGRLLFKKPTYDMAIGCSTGSLIAPFALLGKYELLAKAYSSIENKDIFNINPFTEKGRFKIFNALYRLCRGKKTLGEHENLLKSIFKYYTPDLHEELCKSEKELYVVVCSLTNKENPTQYIRARDHNYFTFCQYMWASCAVPLVTSIVKIEGEEYVDGGTVEGVPLLFAVLQDATKIDTYLHEIKINKGDESSFIADIFHLVNRLWSVIRRAMRKDDLGINVIQKYSKADINIFYLPKELDKSALYFNSNKMNEWIKEGFFYEKSLLKL